GGPRAPRPCAQAARAGNERGSFPSSHARFGKAGRNRHQRALAQVVPPRSRDAGYVERKEDRQGEVRTPGRGNGGAKAAWDQIAPAGADGADKSQRGGALESSRSQRGGPGGFT